MHFSVHLPKSYCKMIFRLKLQYFGMSLWLILASLSAYADNSITGLRLGSTTIEGGAGLRVVIEQEKPIIAELFILDNPYRLVIDSPQTSWNIPSLPPSGSLDKAPAISYRFGIPKPETGRLVIELNAPAAPLRAFTLPPRSSGDAKSGHRLVIDLVDRGATAFRVAQAALKKQPFIAEIDDEQAARDASQKTASEQSISEAKALPAKPVQTQPTTKPQPAGTSVQIQTPSARPERWVVTIDAGHGGKDPGALGGRGTREKDVTLKAAKALAAYLNRTGKVEAKLTRTTDKFIHLRKRIQIARDQKADIFISLHADAAQSKSAHGISVFSLSDTASDKEAAYLARSENQADLIGGPDLSLEDPEAANELLRMFQRESMNESTYLAKFILDQIQDLRGGVKRGHRFAGFAVLKSPDVPSVLVEMGFLTNREDEKNLRRDAYIELVASRLGKAIIKYLEQSGR